MYPIKRDYIRKGKARSGLRNKGVRFIVSHDTGNPGSTAHGNRNWFDRSQPSASAHTFIDDKYILEMIPLTEKAWHVLYNVTTDNKRFGDDANDIAIGVELCWGGSINFKEAYKRYVWYHAYLCERFNLNPRTDIVAHSFLDPRRKTDPQNALSRYGISWSQFIDDVENTLHKRVVKTEAKGVSTMILGKGDRNATVKELQENLNKLGFSAGAVDGIFGSKTAAAVQSFQKKYGLDVDGIAGPATLGKIAELLKPKEKETTEFELGGKKYKITEVD